MVELNAAKVKGVCLEHIARVKEKQLELMRKAITDQEQAANEFRLEIALSWWRNLLYSKAIKGLSDKRVLMYRDKNYYGSWFFSDIVFAVDKAKEFRNEDRRLCNELIAACDAADFNSILLTTDTWARINRKFN